MAENFDLLWGAEEIGRFIGRTGRQTFRLLEAGSIPGKRVGRRWVASRTALSRHFGLEESSTPIAAEPTPQERSDHAVALHAAVLTMDAVTPQGIVVSEIERVFLAVMHDERNSTGPWPLDHRGPRLDALTAEHEAVRHRSSFDEASEDELLAGIEDADAKLVLGQLVDILMKSGAFTSMLNAVGIYRDDSGNRVDWSMGSVLTRAVLLLHNDVQARDARRIIDWAAAVASQPEESGHA